MNGRVIHILTDNSNNSSRSCLVRLCLLFIATEADKFNFSLSLLTNLSAIVLTNYLSDFFVDLSTLTDAIKKSVQSGVR